MSAKLKARLAGGFQLLAVLTGVFAEFVVPGQLGLAAVLIPVLSYVAARLLLYYVLEPVDRRLSALAAFFNLLALTFESVQVQPYGMNIGVGFHGVYFLLIGLLIFQSAFLPRTVGVLVAIGGLAWLVRLVPPLADSQSLYILAPGFLGEVSLCSWLLVMGVNAQRWEEHHMRIGKYSASD